MRAIAAALLLCAATARADDSIDHTLTRAMDAYVNGRYQEAIEFAHRASNAKAWRIIGASGCYLRDLQVVSEACGNLRGRNVDLDFVRYICNRPGNDVEIDRDCVARKKPPPSPEQVDFSDAAYWYRRGFYLRARELAQRESIRDDPRALHIFVLASCRLKDRAGASSALPRLPVGERRALIEVCRTIGVELER